MLDEDHALSAELRQHHRHDRRGVQGVVDDDGVASAHLTRECATCPESGNGHWQSAQLLRWIDATERYGLDIAVRTGIAIARGPDGCAPKSGKLAAQVSRDAFYASAVALIEMADGQDSQ